MTPMLAAVEVAASVMAAAASMVVVSVAVACMPVASTAVQDAIMEAVVAMLECSSLTPDSRASGPSWLPRCWPSGLSSRLSPRRRLCRSVPYRGYGAAAVGAAALGAAAYGSYNNCYDVYGNYICNQYPY